MKEKVKQLVLEVGLCPHPEGKCFILRHVVLNNNFRLNTVRKVFLKVRSVDVNAKLLLHMVFPYPFQFVKIHKTRCSTQLKLCAEFEYLTYRTYFLVFAITLFFAN